MSNFNKDTLLYDTGEVLEWSKDFFDPNGDRLKIIPPEEISQTGLKNGEPFARLWFNNYLFNYSQYLKWLSGEYVEETSSGGVKTQVENFEPLGSIKTIAQTRNFTTTNASTFWGGTWTATTDTIGGVPVDVFQKTALATS